MRLLFHSLLQRVVVVVMVGGLVEKLNVQGQGGGKNLDVDGQGGGGS